jgi:predicted methyltransferase
LTADGSLVEYYARRAGEYEEIYGWRDPDRHKEHEMLVIAIRESLRDRNVIEVAGDTGWWTKILSDLRGV